MKPRPSPRRRRLPQRLRLRTPCPPSRRRPAEARAAAEAVADPRCRAHDGDGREPATMATPAPNQAEVQGAAGRLAGRRSGAGSPRFPGCGAQARGRRLGGRRGGMVGRRRPRRVDRRGRRTGRPAGDLAACPHRRDRRQRDPAFGGRGGAAASLRPRPLRPLRAGTRVARPFADRDGPRLARGGGGAGPRPQPRRDRHPGAALDLGLPGDPRRRHQQDAQERLRDRAADLPGDRPRTTVADFKLVHRLQLGEAPQLERVNQSGEFKRGTIGEAQEPIASRPSAR